MVAEHGYGTGSMETRHGWSGGLLCSSQDSSGFSLVDCPQATERFRSRHRGGPNTRTTYRRVAGQAREPYIQYDPADREQHIRLDKDVCQKPYMTDMAATYAAYQRTDDLKNIAKREELAKLCIDTLTFDVSTLSSAELVKTLEAKQINFDEMHYTEDVHAVIAAQKEAGVKGTVDEVPETFARTKLYLQQHISNLMHSETKKMRYKTTSQHKDLLLTSSMIPLGSGAMKVNSVESLTTSSWTEVMNTHSLALASNREMLNFLEAYLVPEYADLLMIRKYQESIGKIHGNVCIIPKSAHGTDPASAVMCGMKIRRIDEPQGVPIEELRRTRLETEDVKKIELVAVKSCKGQGSSGWNGWRIIVIETECDEAWLDKADKNSQRLETYDAMRKTTENERETKDQITEQTNKYARKGGRRYRQALTGSEVRTEGCTKHAPNGREESKTARDWDPRTHE